MPAHRPKACGKCAWHNVHLYLNFRGLGKELAVGSQGVVPGRSQEDGFLTQNLLPGVACLVCHQDIASSVVAGDAHKRWSVLHP